MRYLVVLAALAVAALAQPPATPVLSQEAVEQLEKKVAQNPGDRESEAVLGKNYAFFILGITSLGKYEMVGSIDPAKASSAFARHAREELGKSKLAPVVGEGGQSLWRYGSEAESDDARGLAIQCLDRAVSLEPDTATWRKYRIPILIHRSNFQDLMPLSAADAYTQVKQDAAGLKGMDRSAMLPYVAKLAVRADALDDARSYAQEMVAAPADGNSGWNKGNLVFFGNMVLGQVALRRGDKAAARSSLIASGKTTGSPQLNSFGPNMSLAKELLAAGERDSVLEFFKLCGQFWKLDRGKLKEWSADVNAGRTPDFGSNLLY